MRFFHRLRQYFERFLIFTILSFKTLALMFTLILLVFIIGYLLITTEHFININKTSTALLTGVLCWVIYILYQSDQHVISEQLMEHLGEISGILFFLVGAMTIVELIDAHDGFEVITRNISTTNKRKLLWIISLLAFFLSAVLDNLTTTIVLITMLRKIVPAKNDRLLFASMIVIAANAGGAFSPIGDVTTTMLWIGNQITSSNIITRLFLASLVNLLVPLFIVSFFVKGNLAVKKISEEKEAALASKSEQKLILGLGIGFLLFVPIFKTITHLPPFMGMLFALGVLWLVTELMHGGKAENLKRKFSVTSALQRMDMPSILFFMGILLSVSALQSAGHLSQLSLFLNNKLQNTNMIGISMGLLSAIIDNVPMVAAAIGMYPLSQFPTDHSFWELLAYCAGTGGSILIIGSASGVAAMGLEKIDFFWYLKKISWIALLGYLAGVAVYILEEAIMHY
jgi:NhaD family Na+/H+ antiporter